MQHLLASLWSFSLFHRYAMNDWNDLVVEADETVHYVASFVHDENSYTYRLIDGVDTYEEKLQGTAILDRCSALNPAVDYATLGDLFGDLHKFLFTKSGRVGIERGQDFLRLDVCGKVDPNTSFKWIFNLVKEVSGILTQELLKAASRLIAENEHLKKTVRRKDLHILDLEGSGATLSRKTLKTEPFDESDIKTALIASVGADRALDILTTPQYKDLQERISLTSTPPVQGLSVCNDARKQAGKKVIKRGILFHDDIEDREDSIGTPIKKMRGIHEEAQSSSNRIIPKKDAAARKLKKL